MPSNALFPPDPLLSHPHFETYKLASSSSSQPVTHLHPAGFRSTTSRLSSRYSSLNVKEVKSRVGWDHLALGAREGEVCYIGEGYEVLKVVLDVSISLRQKYSSIMNIYSRDLISEHYNDVQEHLQPHYIALTTLPTPLPSPTSSSSRPPLSELPSITCLFDASNETAIYLASAGTGTLHAITQDSSGNVEEKEHDLILSLSSEGGETTDGEPYPFLIHRSRLQDKDTVEVIVSRTVRTSANPAAGSGSGKQQISYEILSLTVHISSHSLDSSNKGSRKLEINWTLTGEDFPTYVSRSEGRWLVASGAGLNGSGQGFELVGQTHEEPTTSKPAPSSTVAPELVVETSDKEKEYPYSWSQSQSSLTLTFHLPPNLNPQKDMICLLRPSTLSLGIYPRTPDSVTNNGIAEIVKRFLASGRSDNKGRKDGVGRWDWWDAIDPEESTWRWTRPKTEGDEFGTLEISLEKANAGVRWPSVFAPLQENDPDDEGVLQPLSASAAKDDEEQVEWDVPETLTDQQKEGVKKALEGLHQPSPPSVNFGQAGAGKFAGLGHADFSKTTSSGSGSGKGISHDTPEGRLPGLLQEELEDEDMDMDELEYEFGNNAQFDGGEFGSLGGGGGSKAGKESVWTYIDDEGEGEAVRVQQHRKAPVSILSTAFASNSGGRSVIIKSFVDGQVFAAPSNAKDSAWKHISTNPALSFVLASKKDTQFVYHHQGQNDGGATVYVFESRQANGLGGGNLYIYHPVKDQPAAGQKSKATTAGQEVVKFGEGEKLGALMGVQVVRVGEKDIMVGLLEGGLVVMPI